MTEPNYPSHPSVLELWRGFNEERRDGLYSTDSPAILGLSKWGTPRSVYLEKVEPAELGSPMSMQAFLGLQLETALATMWHERYPEADTPVRREGTFVHPVHDFIRTHIDFTVDIDGQRVLLECKTRTRKSIEWGADGTSKVPVDIWVQCQHEMLVTGLKYAYLVTLFGSPGFHMDYVRVNLQDALADVIIDQEKAFWHDHVVPRVPPPAKTPDEVSAVLSTMRMVEGKRVRLPDEFDSLAALTKDLKASKKAIEADIAAAEARIKLAIGDAEVGETDAGTVWTYREQETKAYTVQGRRSRVLRRRGE